MKVFRLGVHLYPGWYFMEGADIIVSVEAKMYKIRDAKNLNETDMLWLLERDDSDVDNVETNLADSDDNEDYLSEQDEIPDEIFHEENDTISQNSNKGINVLEMQSCDSPIYVSKNGMKWSKISS
ncbi:hypothetical protein FQA39_LY06263 [Lamprigera yunnana]|nr:hypothetical protein FQA39_LY06263 [Lamprigera yunnana]